MRRVLLVAGALAAATVAVATSGGADPVTPAGYERTQQGDTWQSVAARLNVSVTDLQSANNSAALPSGSPGVPGRYLFVPPATLPPTSSSSTTTSTTTAPTTTASTTTSTVAATTTTGATTTSSTTTTGPTGAGFAESFTTPAGFYDRFNYGLSGFHPNEDPNAIQEWEGDHDMSCGGANTSRTVHLDHDAPNDPTSRSLNDISEMFYWCAPGGPDTGHIMTAFEPLGYAYLWFAPNRYFTNVHRICWDQNLTFEGGRKWTQMTVSTRAELERVTAEKGYLDLGFPHPGFQVPGGPTTETIPTTDTWGFVSFGQKIDVWNGPDDKGTVSNFLNTYEEVAPRFQHCVVDNEDGTLTVSLVRPVYGLTVGTIAGDLPDGEVMVGFQDANYDPPKADEYDPGQNTWHWDNIEIS